MIVKNTNTSVKDVSLKWVQNILECVQDEYSSAYEGQSGPPWTDHGYEWEFESETYALANFLLVVIGHDKSGLSDVLSMKEVCGFTLAEVKEITEAVKHCLAEEQEFDYPDYGGLNEDIYSRFSNSQVYNIQIWLENVLLLDQPELITPINIFRNLKKEW